MAVLFADVSDSTRLYESLGDTLAFGQVRQCVGLLTTITSTFGGRVVKSIGDGLMCAFPDADNASQAAAEMQRQIAEHPQLNGGKKLSIRIGFHFGPVIQSGDDVFGDSVNVAARMAGLAVAGQALTTAETVEAMSPYLRESTRQLESLPVKGKEFEVDVHEVLWQPSSDRTVVRGRSAPRPAEIGVSTLIISYRGADIMLTAGAYLGRDADNTVQVADPLASRRHARIELRAGKFVLIDQSSNGTFVLVGTGSEIQLRREEMILHGTGVIAFGHSVHDPGTEVMRFRCIVDQ